MAETFPGPSPKQSARDVSKVKKWAGAKEDKVIAEGGASVSSPEDPSSSTSSASASPPPKSADAKGKTWKERNGG